MAKQLYPLGSRVIVRSNIDEPLMIGVLVGYDTGDGRWADHPIPLVRMNGKVWFTMSHIRPYTRAMWRQLQTLTPLQQWNALVPHHQVKSLG